MRNRRDIGLEVGRWLLEHLASKPLQEVPREKDVDTFMDETAPLIGSDTDSEPPDYTSTRPSPRVVPAATFPLTDEEGGWAQSNLGVTKIFNVQVVLNIFAYGLLA